MGGLLRGPNLFKVFGRNPKDAVARLRAGSTRTEVADAGTAAVIDGRNVTEAAPAELRNEDAPIDSLDELAAASDTFGDRIVGIEPGSALMRVTGEDVVPGYGLEKMKLIDSSTPAMLVELKKATDAGENIAVTLWRPHWAYNAFPVKDLEDPKGLLGDAESIHSIAATSFEADFPEVHEWISNFKMPSDTLYSLEDALFNAYEPAGASPVFGRSRPRFAIKSGA